MKKKKKTNEAGSKTEFSLVEDALNMYKTASNETTLVPEIPNIINEGNAISAPGQGKTAPVLSDEFSEEHAFPHLLPKNKFGYNTLRDIPISPAGCLNQRLMNCSQYFASDADYIFLTDLRLRSTTCIHQ